MKRNHVCAECGGAMQRGYIPFFNPGQMLPLIWVEGKPEKKLVWSRNRRKSEKIFAVSLPM
jgi:hypothetical protein